ncbi:ABC transporter ATP-binding protein [Echinicola strongylocentroti]|uniref:ABC transporter ATP-binding protein n=1 Tax=Echinicola strongylocentroti TaxID=1795355 RepID=A0A2Z4IPB4_9BACT|nr:ATP-binding cassette domain-containing protein [Echinicola strongylocentroti]AWW32193.1 ABC transporter ATP-binding protein [Echinicola strongylocentroti]
MIDLKLKKTLASEGSEMVLDIDLKVESGQLVTLYGPSGAGKTSTLRMISGLTVPDEGRLTVDGECWFDAAKSINLGPGKRKLGFLFQDYALFPNMSVKENIRFALAKDAEKDYLEELIHTMDLIHLQGLRPDQLSGGQKQRTALARALAVRPSVLLLDEPLSALDQDMREKLQTYILKLHQKFQLTTILVSHDPGEILKLSDQVIELDNGKITKICSPQLFFGTGLTSAKFQFSGEVIRLYEEDVVYIVHVKIGNEMVKVVSDLEEARALRIGDKVLVGSKAFNPIIQKL